MRILMRREGAGFLPAEGTGRQERLLVGGWRCRGKGEDMDLVQYD